MTYLFWQTPTNGEMNGRGNLENCSYPLFKSGQTNDIFSFTSSFHQQRRSLRQQLKYLSLKNEVSNGWNSTMVDEWNIFLILFMKLNIFRVCQKNMSTVNIELINAKDK